MNKFNSLRLNNDGSFVKNKYE